MKKILLLPNVVTAFGLSCGLFVIFKINMTPPHEATIPLLKFTAATLLLAVFADLVDGAIARVMKGESQFGGVFDSIADAITFGVAPPVIILKSLSISPKTELSFFLTASAMVYSVCGVLRLVRFTVGKAEEKLDEIGKKYFIGLPIPAAAAAAVSMNLFLASEEFRVSSLIGDTWRALILLFMMVLLGYFMVSQWSFPSLKSLHVRVASFRMVLLTVVFAVLLFYGILHNFSTVFLAVSWGYIVVAWILSLIRAISGKKLEPFDE